MIALLVSAICGADPVGVTLFTSGADPALSGAIETQLSDLEITLTAVDAVISWPSRDADQLHEVRERVGGGATRVAIWFEVARLRVHIADVSSGRQVVREVTLERGGRQAAALMVRSAVASFVDHAAAHALDERLRVGLSWHLSKWYDGPTWAHGPMLDGSVMVAPRLALWAAARYEFAAPFSDSRLKLSLQRGEVALGAQLVFRWPRIELRPRVAMAIRWVGVTVRPVDTSLETIGTANDVGVAVLGGAALAFQIIGPLDAVVQAWATVPLRGVRYLVQTDAATVTTVESWGVEPGAAVGLTARF